MTATLTRRPAARPVREARATIAVMCPLTHQESKAVLHAFDPAGRIVAGRNAGPAEVVIVRPCSPQTVCGLRHRFPTACIVACETDVRGRVTIGPVHRTEETTAVAR